jgi:hypothetical protein
MFLRALTISASEEEPQMPGRYDAGACCRLDEDAIPSVLSAAVTHTRTETKAMRDPSDADEDVSRRLRARGTVAKEAGRDRDGEPSTALALSITKTAGGRDADRFSVIGLFGTETRGRRDRD